MLGSSEAVKKAKKGIKNPRKAYNFLNYRSREYVGKQLNQRFGEKVVEQDWDNLILLDGCRYDIFAEQNTFDGELQSLRSAGSTSTEYFLNNYDGESFPEIAYITANTHFHNIDAKFADIVPARELLWDEDIMTVLPDVLTGYILNHADDYNDKRLVIHFMQPHMPFLRRTETGIKRHTISADVGLLKYSDFADGADPNNIPWWNRLETGEITRKDAFDAYRNTLQIVLEEIKPLLNKLQGKTVVSADHGNAFGEDGIYGHPQYRAHQSLVKVPWFISHNGGRKNTQSADRLTSTQSLSAVDKEKLRALGYV